jgi:hypothetical protein
MTTISLNGPEVLEQIDFRESINISGSMFPTGAQFIELNVPAGNQITFTAQSDSALGLGVAIVPLP